MKDLRLQYLFLLITLATLAGCSKDDDNGGGYTFANSQITVSTQPATNISLNAASVSATTENPESETILSKGLVWNISGNPSVDDSVMTSTADGSSFQLTLTNLERGTTYFVRAFAQVQGGVHYGNEISFTTTSEIVYIGDMVLSSQRDIDRFGEIGYTSVTGRLTIKENVAGDIKNLQGLNSLELLENGLLWIENNQALTTLTGLEGITHLQTLIVMDNPNLQNFMGLDNLVTIETSLSINKCDALVNFSGLSSLTTIPEGMFVRDCAALVNFVGLENATNIFSGAFIDLPSLENFQGLDNLREMKGVVTIRNSGMTSLTGLENLVEIGELYIEFNENLVNLEGLENLREIRGLIIRDNPSLESVASLDSAERIQAFSISDNNNVSILDPLSSLTESIPQFSIRDNLNLFDFCPLQDYLLRFPNSYINLDSNGYNPTTQQIKDGDCSP
jgi:hypothetical protein